MLTTSAGEIQRHFTTPDVDPLDAVEWTKRPAWKEGDPHFRPEVEAPATWSQTAVDICAKLYLAKGEYREDSVRTMIERVVEKITGEGIKAGYFYEDGHPSAISFKAELEHILVNQLAAFNSPVWFNIGRPDRKQCPSACFLNGVEDNSESIMRWVRDEAFIFKAGSGSGANLSNIRGSMEPLSPGGTASGPVSFMRIADSAAGTFKSGGVTRRAAKLVCLDDDHPDIRHFGQVKVKEEERIVALGAAGFDIGMGMDGERTIAESASYQNANNTVRLSDAFMRKATGEDEDSAWPLKARKKGQFTDDVTSVENAREMLDEFAQAAWACADPGVQFHDTINGWHTTPDDGPIRTTNPCAEVSTPDDSSCNLASINIMKFLHRSEDGTMEFDIDGFCHTVDVIITAMDILVEFCELPTEKLTKRTKEYRWLGLGYSNMGAAIMSQAFPYGSDEARDFVASVTALMTARAYLRSAQLAEQMGAFDGFEANRQAMFDVIAKHEAAVPLSNDPVWLAAQAEWVHAMKEGIAHGYRNAQVTVLAPAGSISYFMDCDTTGIEPPFSLDTDKQLAGGGSMKIISKSAREAAISLGGYSTKNLEQMSAGDFSCVVEEDRASFACAGDIAPEDHVKMIAAVQPFLSGSISKTINMSASATWQEIKDMYVLAWRLGVKCMSVYRDGSKARQPLSTKKEEVKRASDGLALGDAIANSSDGRTIDPPRAQTPHAEDAMEGPVGAERRRMPRDAQMLRHKWNLGGFEGYLMVGLYEDGTPGEFFLEDIGKEGSHVKGMTSAWAIQCSTALQYGQPLEVMVRKYIHMNFEPNGRTECSEIPTAQSLPDYVMRWMALKFLPHMHAELGLLTEEEKRRRTAELDMREQIAALQVNGNGRATVLPSAPPTVPLPRVEASIVSGGGCPDCGGLLQRAGSCLQCRCGYNSGCS